MMKYLCCSLAFVAGWLCVQGVQGQINPPPVVLQQLAFGGSANDVPYQVLALPDGGIIMGGESSSTNGTHASPAYGAKDYWVVRLDASGSVVWDRSFGGVGDDQLYGMALARSNRLVLAGGSSSPPSGNKTSLNYGLRDFWVILLDQNGQMIWERSFGGAGDDFATCVAETEDGGFVVAGYSQSAPSGNKTAPLRGAGDFWVVRLDANGNKLWDQSYGGTGDNCAYSLVTVPGGSVVVAGSSDSPPSGNKQSPNYGSYDLWVVCLDSGTNILWEKSYGGDSDDGYYNVSLCRTATGDLIVGADSYSGATGNKTSPNFGQDDFWIVRLDPSGNRLWETNCGGTGNDYLTSLLATSDGGCIAAGGSNSSVSGNKTSPCQGSTDFWLVKLDAQGNRQWDKAVGGSDPDAFLALSIAQATNGNLICCGDSFSDISGDKTVPSFGGSDFWLVTLVNSSPAAPPRLQMTFEAGTLQLLLVGEPGQTYVTEASTSLQAWSPVATNQLTGTTAVVVDPGQGSSSPRFYRARLAQ